MNSKEQNLNKETSVELIPEEKVEVKSSVGMSKGRKIVLGAVSALALALVAGGSALVYAQSTDSSTGFLDRVAQIAGVDSSKLKDAFKQASIEKVDAKVADGTITQDQADSIIERINSDDFRGPMLGGPGGMGMRGGPGMFGLRESMDEVATFLGMTESDLRTELQSGKTLLQVAESKGKTEAQMKELLSTKFDENLQKAVDDKRITQTEADKIKANKDDIINKLLTTTPPEPKGGRGLTDEDSDSKN